jgi:hypothetical protein
MKLIDTLADFLDDTSDMESLIDGIAFFSAPDDGKNDKTLSALSNAASIWTTATGEARDEAKRIIIALAAMAWMVAQSSAQTG